MMMKRTLQAAFASLLTIAGAQTVFAAPIATLSFTAPTGIVGPTDAIDIYMTLTLDPASDPLIVSNGNVMSGVSLADILANLTQNLPTDVDPAVDNLFTGLSLFYECSGTFTTGCDGPPYNFTFAPFSNWADFDLAPGASVNFLFGTFTPTGGSAPAGTYTFGQAGLFIPVYDLDFSDPDLLQIAQIPLANIRDSGGPAFSRTVVDTRPLSDVPEPASFGLMLGGLTAAFGLIRRKARR